MEKCSKGIMLLSVSRFGEVLMVIVGQDYILHNSFDTSYSDKKIHLIATA